MSWRRQGSYINCGGTAYVDFTADGSHNLLGINSNTSSEQTVDLTSKGCTYSVDTLFDDNPDWVIDWYDVTATLNHMTLTFTYPPFPEYTIQYDPNGGSGYMPSETVRTEEFSVITVGGHRLMSASRQNGIYMVQENSM